MMMLMTEKQGGDTYMRSQMLTKVTEIKQAHTISQRANERGLYRIVAKVVKSIVRRERRRKKKDDREARTSTYDPCRSFRLSVQLQIIMIKKGTTIHMIFIEARMRKEKENS